MNSKIKGTAFYGGADMAFTGKNNKIVHQKDSLINSGMKLTDDELSGVSGGMSDDEIPEMTIYKCECGCTFAAPFPDVLCPICGTNKFAPL